MRLGRALGLRLLLLWAITAFAISIAIEHELDELYDASLMTVADVSAVIAAASRSPSIATNASPTQPSLASDEREIEHELFTYRVREIERTPGLDDASPRIDDVLAQRVTLQLPGDPARVVEISERRDERREAMLEIVLAILLPVFVVVPLSLLGLRSVLTRELEPLVALGSEIGRRGRHDLTRIEVPGVPAELGTIVDEVNAMIERLRRALEAEREFAARNAHELRTPLAGALAQTQRLHAEASDERTRERADAVLTALDRLQDLGTKLLELSRADGAGVVSDTPVALAPVIRAVIDELAHANDAEGRLQLVPGAHGPLARIDADAFYMLMRNLVENALVHGDPTRPVVVRYDAQRVSVENGGRLFDRAAFDAASERVADADAPPRSHHGTRGRSGLGLAIVRAIADGGDIAIEVTSPTARGDGTRITVRLPQDDGPDV